MSVKCNYSDKYYPLLETWKLHPETFESNVREFFSNAEEVLNGSVVQNNTPLRSMEVKRTSYNSGLEVSTDVQSVDQFYINAPSKYRQMSNAFMRRMVESAIYNPKTETLIDANQLIGDVSYLNQAILDYKTSLLSTIANYLNANGISYNGSPNDLEAIQDFVLQNYIPSIDNIEVYNAYVIITNFDKLLSLHAPFIKVTPEYTKSSQYHPKRYTYIGAEVKHYTGVMSTDEFMSAENNTSDIVKILLQYFQEVDENNHPIEGTSINLGGFNSAMSKVFAWAQTNEAARVILAEDSNADFGKIIGMYLDSVKGKKVKDAHITYLTNKLRGIKHFIYGSKIPDELKIVFTHLVEKTVPSSYIQYDIVGTDATIKYLTERSILLQRTFLNECVDTAAEYWKVNKTLYDTLLENKGYTIKVQQTVSNTYVVNINDQTITISGGQHGSIQLSGEIENIVDIVEDIAQLFISEDTLRVGEQLYGTTNLTKLYAPVIASIIVKSQLESASDFKTPFGPMQELARVLSIMHGADVINVVKNGEGNNLPLYQMLCLSYRHHDIHKRLEEDRQNRDIQTPYFYNIVYKNIDHIHAPQIRAGVLAKDGTYKTAASLSTDEVMHLAILHDFYDNLTTEYTLDENSGQRSGIVGFQSHVYSDKNKHFIQMFDLSAEWVVGYDDAGYKITINPAELIKAYLNGDHDDLEPLVQAFYYSGKNQIDTIIENLLDDYRAVFPDREIKDLKDIEKIISNYKGKIDELRQKFIANGINFVEEIHISKSGVNETLYYLQRQFATLDSTRDFLNSQFKQFKEDTKGARKTIKKALDSRKKAPDINRLLHAYFLADVLFTNDYNRMMVGQVFAHTHKNKRKVSDIQMELGWSSSMSEERRAQIEKQAKDIWESENYAARWISQVKRMVIYGATYHSYAQGLKYGVPEFIKTAVFEDIPSNVFSITGDSDKVDSMDGSGWTSPIFSRLQNYSLLDAAVGANKKTIYHDIESKYGVPTLLKWAEYEITNEKRRNSYTTSLENLYRRMHNLQFDSSISFEYIPENLYYTDNKGNYYEIDAIEVKNGIGYMLRTRVQPNGKRIEVVDPILIQVNTIYDIDQLLGGAWAMTKEDDRLVFTESNMDILTKIVCDNNLKDYMIGWAVNKSGMKVGVTNLNTVDTWNNDTELRYVTLSTRFGGLQMNADHELDHAEVTEMTQMISALEQMGVMHDRVVEIYREIGKFCYDSIADIAAAAYSDTDKDKLYQIYGRAIIEAFNSGNKDTLGLAQSFISIAQRSIQDNKITYQIPFSSASINGIFNSTVTSQLIKKSIRRHYSGVAAVLNPSFNVIEHYTVNGLQYRKEELYDIIKEALDARNLGYLLDKYSVDDFISNWEFILNSPNVTNGTILLNPFVHEITYQMQNLDGTVWYSNDQIDFEDTVVIINEVYDENGNVIDTTFSAPIKIDTFEKYDMVKHDPRRKLIHTLRPRNLKGANTTFTINGETKSIFESPYTITLKYFNSSSATDAKTFESELETIFTKEYTKIFDVTDGYASVLAKNHMVIMNYLMEAFKAKTGLDGYTHPNMFKHYLIQQQQLLLNAIADGNPFDWFGETVTATDVKVHGAQIGMGKLFAKQFGLRKGDSLSQIKKEGPAFFYHRIKENFAISNNDPETYDCVLYDGQGTKLHVKILPKAEWAKFKTDTPLYRNEEYITVDGIIYHNGEELFAGEGKEIHTYVDSQNNESDLILIDNIDRLQELINDGDYIYTEYNYTVNNHQELIKFKYKGDDFRVVVGINPNTGKTQWRTITNAELNTINPEELIDILTIHETKSLHHRIGTWAEEKYENFLKSLNFVGTRIPCQNMTSFAPMEVVMFSDVEANEIYLPTTITWLEGSDYDIDKTYLLGFSVANNGKIHTEGKSKRYQGDRLRNTVVNGIMDIIKNPRTQINLTNPLSMEHMQDLSSKSILGKAARRMTSFNPACKYMMQIENMVGKGVIGNVATAIKSFFALSTVYNEAYSNIYKELINGNFEAVRSLLNKYSFKQNDKYRTLANVNMELFMNINWDIIPEDIKTPLLEIIEWQAGLSDQSLILGELLNSATDNAKELILKKINADTNWVDIYTSAFMLGEDLSDIGDFMISPEITELINKFTTNIFDKTDVGTKTMFIEQAIKDASSEHEKALYTELLERVNISEELRIFGKILKINQGMPTKTIDLYKYVNSIESFIEGRLNISKIQAFKQASLKLDSFNTVGNIILKLINDVRAIAGDFSTITPELKTKIAEDVSIQRNISDLNDYKNHPFFAQWIADINKDLLNFVKTAAINGEELGFMDAYNTELKFIQRSFYASMDSIKKNWIKFSFINFLQNPSYQAQLVNQYDTVKVKFNILDALISSPHFSEMQKVLALNSTILNALSKRNNIEANVWQLAKHKNAQGNPALLGSLNDSERKALKTLTEQTLISEWLTVGLDGMYIEYGGQRFDFNSGFDSNKFKNFVESIIIPLLKYNMLKTPNGDSIPTRDNEFVKKLTFGKSNGVPIYKLPFNMTEIDSDESTRLEYEKILNAFGDLRNITLHGGLNITDVFYLYNLIVHNDHFGRNSLTRLFEDLIASKDGEKLLVFKFNEWLEQVDVKRIVDKVLDIWGARIDTNNKNFDNGLNDVERFNSSNKSLEILNSSRTILSNDELRIWNNQGITNPRILVASEHSDPAFHTKLILDVLDGTTSITDWKGDKISGHDVHGLYIITKHDGLPIRKLLETKIPKLIHFSITTLGGTQYEPGVMKYNDLLDRIAEYIKLGLDPNTVTIRIDPIVPGVTNNKDIEEVMRRSAEMGITRIKFSVMDAYTNTVDAMSALGYDFSKYYVRDDSRIINGKPTFHAMKSVLDEISNTMLTLAQKYNLKLSTCAEPLVRPGISSEGCLAVSAVNQMLGTQIEDKGTDNNQYRKLCSCFGGKIDVLKYGDVCNSHCVYCYAKHENDTAMRYYNEDGTLKHNAFTDVYWVPSQSTSKTVKYTPKGQAEQTYTIIGTKIFNKEGDEVYTDENSGHRKLIFVELALQEKRAVKVEYRNVTYIVNDRNQIFSTSSNKIVYQNENDGNRRIILERAKEEFAKLSNQSSPRVEIYQGYWTRKEVESQTGKVFLFGDNTDDRVNTHYVPSRTQAVIRGLDNAVGIDTKKNRGTSENSYFTDADFDTFQAQVDEAIQRAIDSGKTIVLPEDGIGTGKAQLKQRAPKLFNYLQNRLTALTVLGKRKELEDLFVKHLDGIQLQDGTIISNELTVDFLLEKLDEEAITIGFDNSTDRTDDAEIIEEVVEPETKSGIVLNTEQQTAVDGIVAHINSGNLEPVLLNGKAGTGKTTIIAEILKQIDPNHKVWVGAVTHKASAVLFNKLQGLPQFITKKTVASMTDKKFDLSTGEFSEKSSWAQDPAAIPSIIFVDEASMVTKDDFVKITEFAKNNGAILIFIGDDGQLPPVEKSGEKSKIFALPKRYNLVERVRQGEESPILPYADGYWNYSHNKGAYPSTNPKDVITRQGAIVFSPGSILRSDNTLALFKKAVQLNKLNSVKVITWTNEVRQNVNHFIHSSLFGKEKWYKGEFIIFNDTLRKGKEIIAENSSEWVIESIGDAQEYTGAFDDYSVTCKIRFATITDGDRTVMVKLFATDLDKASWTEYWNNKLVEVRKIYSQNPKKYNRVLAKIYANLQEMANVDYAYAITCHKSQGSTYDSVFVTSEIHSNQDNELKAQWLYTAITRARNVVTMIHGDGKFTGDVGELNNNIENNRARTADTGAIPAADYVESSPNQSSLFSDDSLRIDSDQTPAYQTTPSKQSKLIEVVRQANESGIKGLHIVSNSDLINEPIEVRSALGFVRNGEIYINVDKAKDDTVIHEFGHLYLADAKVNNRDAYYALLDKVRNTELWRKMKTWRAYANKIGSDFDEEVLATMIGDYYKHINSAFGQDYEYETLVKEALSLVNQSFMDLINSEILPDLGDTFITNYALQQKIATIKGRLVSDNILKENCQ